MVVSAARLEGKNPGIKRSDKCGKGLRVRRLKAKSGAVLDDADSDLLFDDPD